jgi:hypothetical protein
MNVKSIPNRGEHQTENFPSTTHKFDLKDYKKIIKILKLPL